MTGTIACSPLDRPASTVLPFDGLLIGRRILVPVVALTCFVGLDQSQSLTYTTWPERPDTDRSIRRTARRTSPPVRVTSATMMMPGWASVGGSLKSD
jgi:hypothetical protein